VKNFNPRRASCLISFEALMTECEACSTRISRGSIEAADRTFAQSYDMPAFL
jgi:hypothetical protein